MQTKQKKKKKKKKKIRKRKRTRRKKRTKRTRTRKRKRKRKKKKKKNQKKGIPRSLESGPRARISDACPLLGGLPLPEPPRFFDDSYFYTLFCLRLVVFPSTSRKLSLSSCDRARRCDSDAPSESAGAPRLGPSTCFSLQRSIRVINKFIP